MTKRSKDNSSIIVSYIIFQSMGQVLFFGFFKQIAIYYCYAIFLGKKKDFDIAQKKQKTRPDSMLIYLYLQNLNFYVG